MNDIYFGDSFNLSLEPMVLLSPQDVLYFQTIAKTKNLRAAAEILHVTQPALSHSLKRLEQAVKDPLFERTSRGLKLTQIGTALLESSVDALESWRRLSDREDSPTSAPSQLRIGVHASVATYLAPTFLAALNREIPGIGLDLVHGLSREVTRMVITGELDMAFAINPVRNSSLVIREILTDNVMVLGTETVDRIDHIVFDPALAQSQWILKALEKRRLRFATQTHSSSLEVIRSFVEAGSAVGILPLRVAMLSPTRLIPAIKDGPTYSDRLCFICRPFFARTAIGKQVVAAARVAGAKLS